MIGKLPGASCPGCGNSYAEREAEVFMLLMHLSLEGRLPERPGKVWGFETGVI